MCKQKEIIFEVHVDHKRVREAICELEERAESKVVREASIRFYAGLLASDVISVPESQLSRVLPFIKELD